MSFIKLVVSGIPPDSMTWTFTSGVQPSQTLYFNARRFFSSWVWRLAFCSCYFSPKFSHFLTTVEDQEQYGYWGFLPWKSLACLITCLFVFCVDVSMFSPIIRNFVRRIAEKFASTFPFSCGRGWLYLKSQKRKKKRIREIAFSNPKW